MSYAISSTVKRTGFVFYKATNPRYQRTTSPIVAFKPGEKGYWPINTALTPSQLNHEGVTEDILNAAEIGSMFGWECLGAKPALDYAKAITSESETPSIKFAGECHES